MLAPMIDTPQLDSNLIAPYTALSSAATTAAPGLSQQHSKHSGLTSTGAMSITTRTLPDPAHAVPNMGHWSQSTTDIAGDTQLHPACTRTVEACLLSEQCAAGSAGFSQPCSGSCSNGCMDHQSLSSLWPVTWSVFVQRQQAFCLQNIGALQMC